MPRIQARRLRRRAGGQTGERRWKAISRHVAYHGTTMGALSINGIPALRTPFEPLVPEVLHVRNTNRYHRPTEETEERVHALPARRARADDRGDGPRDGRDGDHGAGAERGRRASRRRRATGAGVREICDRYEILLCADEVITGFGRLGAWFGSERYDIRPDLVTCAKGLSSAYASIGAVIATDRVMEPFLAGRADVHARHHLRRPSGPGGDRAQEPRDHEAREDRRARARAAGRRARRSSSSCSSCRSSATCAARASSTRSSSSRTRRRARRSRTRSASGCCAAS